jgi:hypothetical protein
MPDSVAAATVAMLALASLCALSVAIPQAVLLVKLWRRNDGIAVYTAKTVLWTSAVAVGIGWRCLIWLDGTYFDQRYLGTAAQRWPAEVGISVFVALACFYAAGLYHLTVTFERRRA